MRPGSLTIDAGRVQSRARHLLITHLRLTDYKRSVPARLLAALMLLAAVTHSSLCCACQLHPRQACYDSARKALHANLPRRPRDLLTRILAALHACLPHSLRAVPQILALDFHHRPFYGKKGTRGSKLCKKKAGTKRCFAYATLATVGPAGRFTIGLLATPATMRLTTVLQRLLDQAAQAGISVDYLMADKEFHSAEVIDWLQRRKIAFIIPAQRHGRRPDSGNRRFFEPATTSVGWYDYRWTAKLRKRDVATGQRRKRGTMEVKVRVCVARNPKEGKRNLVYLCGGLAGWSPSQVRNAYRRRFGIEAKYRQLGRCLARTTSRCERVRLVWVGLALLVLNVWAQLHAEAFATGPLGARVPRLGVLRLTVLRFWIAVVIVLNNPPIPQWHTQRLVPKLLTDGT